MSVRTPTLCTGATPNSSSAWVMVASADATGWAQSGYVKRTDVFGFLMQSRRYSGDTPVTRISNGGIAPNVGYTFKVQYNASCNCLQFYWGSIRVDADTTWNPFTIWGSGTSDRFQLQLLGESWWREDTLPGTDANRATWATLRGQNLGDSFVTVPCGTFMAVNDPATPPQPVYHISSMYNSCQSFDLWSTSS